MNDQDIAADYAMVADSVRQFAESAGGLDRARRFKDADRFDVDWTTWRQAADLGWIGIAVPEERGGSGMGWRETCALLETAGRYLLPDPLVPALSCAYALAACAGREADDALTGLLSGQRLSTLLDPVSATSTATTVVIDDLPDCPPHSDLIVPLAVDGRTTLVLLPHDAEGIRRTTTRCVDGGALTRLDIAATAWSRALPLGEGARVQAALADAHDLSWLAYAAYLNGLARAALGMTLDYLSVRTQFGRAIGTFQALQHRMASCHVEIIASQAVLSEACGARGSPRQARAARAAIARAGESALRTTQDCIQCHGAIGFADEHDIGLFLRRAMAIAARGSGGTRHLLEYADLLDAASLSSP